MSYVVVPKEGGDRHAFLIAHGAGRKWSRSESRGHLEKRFSTKDLMRTELGSQVVCEDKELLYEEAPQAYKNISVVIDDLVQAGLVDVAATGDLQGKTMSDYTYEVWLQVSAGQGPPECAWAVIKTAEEIRREAAAHHFSSARWRARPASNLEQPIRYSFRYAAIRH
jgi:hypothetical protein